VVPSAHIVTSAIPADLYPAAHASGDVLYARSARIAEAPIGRYGAAGHVEFGRARPLQRGFQRPLRDCRMCVRYLGCSAVRQPLPTCDRGLGRVRRATDGVPAAAGVSGGAPGR